MKPPASPPPIGPQSFLSPAKGRIEPLGRTDVEMPSSPVSKLRSSTTPSSTSDSKQERQRFLQQKAVILEREQLAATRHKGQHDAAIRHRAALLDSAKMENLEKEAREVLLRTAQAQRPLTAGTPRVKMGPKDATAVAPASSVVSVGDAIKSARKEVEASAMQSVREFGEKSRQLQSEAKTVARDRASQYRMLNEQATNLAHRRETVLAQQRSAASRADKLITAQRMARDHAASKAEALKKRILEQREKVLKARESAWDATAHWQPTGLTSYKEVSSPRGWNEQLASDAAHKRRLLQRTSETLNAPIPMVPSPRKSPPPSRRAQRS